MKVKKLILMAASASLLLSGCEEFLGPAGDVSGSFGGAVQGQLEMFATYLAASPLGNPSNDIQMPAMFANPFDGCTTYSKGTSFRDSDFSVRFNCQGIPGETSGVIGLVGFMTQSSVNGNLDDGYRFDNEMMIKYVFAENTLLDKYKGFSEMKKTSTEIRYTSDFEVQVLMTNHTPPVDYVWKRSISRVFIPDDMSNPMASGRTEIAGLFTMNGKIGGGPGGQDLGITKFGFTINSQNLVYKSTCMYGFDSGTITFVDGANNKVVFEYLCGSRNLTLNGKPVN